MESIEFDLSFKLNRMSCNCLSQRWHTVVKYLVVLVAMEMK